MDDVDAAAPSAWVLHAEDPRDLGRALRVLGRLGTRRQIALDRSTVCVELENPAPPAFHLKIGRRLDRPVEGRLDCDVAWYPTGSGYVAFTVTQPAPTLDEALESYGPAYREVIRPSDPALPVRICVPELAVADPLALAEAMKAQGIGVLATYEVGGCRR